MSHYDCKECHQDPVSGHAPECSRGKAMDELIAGDADLYDVPYSEQDAWEWLHAKYKGHPNDRDFGSDDMVDAFMEGRCTLPRDIDAFATALETGLDFNVMKHIDVRMCCDGHHCGCRGATVGEYLAHELRTASARIKGDKDRATQSSAPSEDYLLGIAEGTAMAAPQDHWTVKAAIKAARDLIAAGDTLSLQAQTTGGVAGKDAALGLAIIYWEQERKKCQRRLQIIELEGDDPEIGIGARLEERNAGKEPT